MNKPIKQLVLSLTGQCNFCCSYCYAADHAAELMTANIALKALELVEKNNQGAQGVEPFIVQFSGGEPLLNWTVLSQVVLYVKQHQLPVQLQLQTNASLLDASKASFLYEHGVGIGISLDGRPKVNDLQRLTKDGSSATLATLKGIEILKRNNIACGLTCVVTSQNVEYLGELVEFAYYLGNIRRIGFDLLRHQGRGNRLEPPTSLQMEAAMEAVYDKLEQLEKLFGYRIILTQEQKCTQLQQSEAKNTFSHCSAMTGEALFVDAKGQFYGCASYVGNDEFYIGSVETGLFENNMKKVSAYIQEAMSSCLSCASFKACGGGCLARWYDGARSVEYKSECVLKLSANRK